MLGAGVYFLSQLMPITLNVMAQFEQMLNQEQWSVFYLNDWCEGQYHSDIVKHLSFDDAIQLIRTLPKKWATEDEHDDSLSPADWKFPTVTQHIEGLPSLEPVGWVEAVTITGPYLSYGAPQSWNGEAGGGCELQQLTFTKDKILSIVDLD